MNLHRQNLVALRIVTTLLARPHRTLDDGIDDLEMRGIEGQRHVHVAGSGFEVGREALVVLDVARAAQLGEIVVSLEFVEQILRRFAEQVHQYIETAAVGHADDGFLDSGTSRPLHQIVKQRNEAVAALQRETLLADIPCVKIPLEPFRRRQLPQNVLLFVRGEVATHAGGLKCVLQPESLVAVRDVGEFGADGVAINEFQGI